jgi:membrane-associated phospholipid phosphatase
MSIVLSIVMLAALALVLAAILAWRKGLPKKQIGLLLLLALVMAVNVAIWTVPDGEGQAPIDRVE